MNTATGCIVAFSQDLNVSTTFVPGEHWDPTAQVFTKIDTTPSSLESVVVILRDSCVETVRNKLLSYLALPGHTQVVLAEETGVSQSVISRISSGLARRLTPETISRLAPIIGLDMVPDPISTVSAPTPKQEGHRDMTNDERLRRALYYLIDVEKNLIYNALDAYALVSIEHDESPDVVKICRRLTRTIKVES